MSLVVIDASTLVAFYASDNPHRDAVVARSGRGDVLLLRRTWMPRSCPPFDGSVGKRPCPEGGLRDNIMPYDAAYVTLTERLGGSLITCVAKMAGVPGTRCGFDVLTWTRRSVTPAPLTPIP